MGGTGSGWYERKNTKPTVEAGRSLNVQHWLREGLLKPGLRFNLAWGQQGTLTVGVAVEVEDDQVTLTYRHPQADSTLIQVEYAIVLEWMPQPFGGYRPWFHCPNAGCGKRVLHLYLGSDYRFACRSCQGLTYTSQRQNPIDRNLRRSQKIKQRLGNGDKPKGMPWSTYQRLIETSNAAMLRAMHSVINKADKAMNV